MPFYSLKWYQPTIKWASGYLNEFVFTLLLNANANVSVPTRPMNIEKIIMIFPSVDKSPVMPIEIPTVANAETCSNTIFKISLSDSVSESKNMATVL